MDAKDFRRIVLGPTQTVDAAHMGHADVRDRSKPCVSPAGRRR